MPTGNHNGRHHSKTGDKSIPEHNKTLPLEDWVQCTCCRIWRHAPDFQPLVFQQEFTCDELLGGCTVPEDTTWLAKLCFSGATSKTGGVEHVYIKNALRALLFKLEGYMKFYSWPEIWSERAFRKSDLGVWELKPARMGVSIIIKVINYGLQTAQNGMSEDEMCEIFKRILAFVPVHEEDLLLDHYKKIHEVYSLSSLYPIPIPFKPTLNNLMMMHAGANSLRNVRIGLAY